MLKVQVKRAFYGDEKGVKAGDVIKVTEPRGKELEKRGLVVILGVVEEEAEAPDAKQAQTPDNKQAQAPATKGEANTLRNDDPTVAEYVDAGYLASNYPPNGFASRSTPEEIAAAVAAQKSSAEENAKGDAEAAAKNVEEKAAKAKTEAKR